MLNAILSIAMLSAFLLLYGAWKRWRREGVSQQMWLMVAAALVVFANVAIWVVPNDKGIHWRLARLINADWFAQRPEGAGAID